MRALTTSLQVLLLNILRPFFLSIIECRNIKSHLSLPGFLKIFYIIETDYSFLNLSIVLVTTFPLYLTLRGSLLSYLSLSSFSFSRYLKSSEVFVTFCSLTFANRISIKRPFMLQPFVILWQTKLSRCCYSLQGLLIPISARLCKLLIIAFRNS